MERGARVQAVVSALALGYVEDLDALFRELTEAVSCTWRGFGPIVERGSRVRSRPARPP